MFIKSLKGILLNIQAPNLYLITRTCNICPITDMRYLSDLLDKHYLPDHQYAFIHSDVHYLPDIGVLFARSQICILPDQTNDLFTRSHGCAFFTRLQGCALFNRSHGYVLFTRSHGRNSFMSLHLYVHIKQHSYACHYRFLLVRHSSFDKEERKHE